MNFLGVKLLIMTVAILVLGTTSITIGSQSSIVKAQVQQAQKPLTLGVISQNANDSGYYQPLVNYIVSKLSNGKVGEVIIADSSSKMSDLLKNQSVDLYLDSSLISALVDNKSGAVPFLRGWN